jgi:Domain of unknown function (DUF4905)
MDIKRIYSFSNNRQIWRLLPTETNKLIIEERDIENKEVFFNCIDISTGERIFSDFQLDEKFWVGIEAIDREVIYFHKFLKPDMPGHLGIIAFDINSESILWENSEYSFLFIDEGKIYCYKSLFEGRNFFVLDSKTGQLIGDLGDDISEINLLRDKSLSKQMFHDYIFPQMYFSEDILPENILNIFNEIKNEKVIAGKMEYALFQDILFFNYHEVLNDGQLKNTFLGVEINSNKRIFQEILINKTSAFVPDSFFFRQNLMFLLQEKIRLVVYNLKS